MCMRVDMCMYVGRMCGYVYICVDMCRCVSVWGCEEERETERKRGIHMPALPRLCNVIMQLWSGF